MKLCFLVSGIPRTFYNNLHTYFIELHKYINFDVYINFSEESVDTIYTNKEVNLNILYNFSFYKYIKTSSDINFKKTKKENNILNQWNRLYELFNLVKYDYTHYVRIRPDIKILMNPADFIFLLTECNTNSVYIPNGYDMYDSVHITNDISNNCINDQIAICNKENMKLYCDFYDIISSINTNFYSEIELYKYLNANIEIKRIILPYKLILSECKVISITGDSGSGKSTLTSALESILFDSYLTIETDRYHKWERSSSKWNNYTHLNPEANFLEKMSEDVYRLKLGETIFSVDYDHTTGKFTEEKKIESKPYILLCGLHTLYEKNMRNISEIKIFLDTDYELKKKWKIQRDVHERNHPIDKVLESMEKRKSEYEKYINPQKFYSDIIIEYTYDDNLNLNIHVSNELNYYVNSFLCQISIYKNNVYKNFHTYKIDRNKITDNIFPIFIKNKEIYSKLKEFPFNIIQTIIYLSFFND